MRRTLYTEEHEAFRKAFRAFIDHSAVPHVEAWEDAGTVDRQFIRAAGENGFLGFEFGAEFGGLGIEDFRYNAVMTEEVVASGMAGDLFSMQNDIIVPYLRDLATPEQQQRWLPAFTRGECVTALGLTEPGAGSDLAAIKASARRDGDHLVLNGQKTFITSGATCDLAIVLVRTGERDGRGTTFVAVENGTPGFERGRPMHKIGRKAQDTAELFFEDCRVPVSNIIGEPGRGFGCAIANLPRERLSIAVAAVASARHALALGLDHVRQRNAFGGPLAQLQSVRMQIAEMHTDIEVLRRVCRPLCGGAQRRRADRRRGGRREVQGDRTAVGGPRPGAAAVRRLRLHGGVSDRTDVARCADPTNLWRIERGHEGPRRASGGGLMSRLNGRVAVVTGSSRGVGRGIALRLAADGAAVAVNYRRDADAADEVVAEIVSAGGRAKAYGAAINDAAAVDAMVQTVRADLGPVDIVVSNAGTASKGQSVGDTPGADFLSLLQVHTLGPIHLIQRVLPDMRAAGRGDVVMISSSTVGEAPENSAPYTMAKAAMEMCAHAGREERVHAIRANIVAPGLVETDMGRRLVKAATGGGSMEDIAASYPFGRVCTPADIAGAVALPGVGRCGICHRPADHRGWWRTLGQRGLVVGGEEAKHERELGVPRRTRRRAQRAGRRRKPGGTGRGGPAFRGQLRGRRT